MKKLTKVSDYIWRRLKQITSSKHVFLLSGGGTMITSPLEDLYPFLDRKIFLKNMLIKPLT